MKIFFIIKWTYSFFIYARCRNVTHKLEITEFHAFYEIQRGYFLLKKFQLMWLYSTTSVSMSHKFNIPKTIGSKFEKLQYTKIKNHFKIITFSVFCVQSWDTTIGVSPQSATYIKWKVKNTVLQTRSFTCNLRMN